MCEIIEEKLYERFRKILKLNSIGSAGRSFEKFSILATSVFVLEL
jgi:hypothetical protein